MKAPPKNLCHKILHLSFLQEKQERTVVYVSHECYVEFLNVSKRTCEANPAGENSSFIFAVRVKSVPLYYFKLAYVVQHKAVKEFYETRF